MESIKIIIFCVLSACVYGIAHDMVTTHVCVEYFLPPVHPLIVPTKSSLLLALIWGIIATWWVGLFFGIILAMACRIGRKPKLSLSHVLRPIFYMLISLFFASMLLGLIGYMIGWLNLLENLPDNAEQELRHKHATFLFNVVAHQAAYFLGSIGGGIVVAYSLWRRTVLFSQVRNSH